MRNGPGRTGIGDDSSLLGRQLILPRRRLRRTVRCEATRLARTAKPASAVGLCFRRGAIARTLDMRKAVASIAYDTLGAVYEPATRAHAFCVG